jgi:hypothetical protein
VFNACRAVGESKRHAKAEGEVLTVTGREAYRGVCDWISLDRIRALRPVEFVLDVENAPGKTLRVR